MCREGEREKQRMEMPSKLTLTRHKKEIYPRKKEPPPPPPPRPSSYVSKIQKMLASSFALALLFFSL